MGIGIHTADKMKARIKAQTVPVKRLQAPSDTRTLFQKSYRITFLSKQTARC